jgi:hypothetical protein
MGTQSQSQGQGQSQSQSQGHSRLSDEDYLEAADEEPHPDSPPGSRRDKVEDPQRSTGAEDRSNSM